MTPITLLLAILIINNKIGENLVKKYEKCELKQRNSVYYSQILNFP